MTSLHATRLSEPGTLSRRGTTSQVRASLPVTRESVSNCGGLSIRSDGTREPNPYGSVFLWEPHSSNSSPGSKRLTLGLVSRVQSQETAGVGAGD